MVDWFQVIKVVGKIEFNLEEISFDYQTYKVGKDLKKNRFDQKGLGWTFFGGYGGRRKEEGTFEVRKHSYGRS